MTDTLIALVLAILELVTLIFGNDWWADIFR